MTAVRRRPLRTVRARTTLAATLVVAVAFAVSAIAIIGLLRSSLISNVDDTIRLRARDVIALAKRDPLPDPLPVIGEERGLVQVVGRDGTVIAASGNARDEPALGPFEPVPGLTAVRSTGRLPVGDGIEFRVVTLTSTVQGRSVTVYVAASLGPAEHTIALVTTALAVGFPLLLILVAVTTWVVVGRALRPVESIRRRVAEISSSEPDQRVPEPETDDEVGRLAQTMNAMLGRLEASAQHERRFVDDASHELRTPLSVVLANLELALKDSPTLDWRERVRDAQREGLRMQRLVTDLLLLARADNGALPLVPLSVDLGAIVRAEVSERSESTMQIDITQVQRTLVLADPDPIRQVVRNLLDNALRNCRSRVTLTVAQQLPDVELTVSDDGPGVPAEERERVFDRFVRLDDARNRDSGGTGLGLAICREILARQHGSIHVADGDGGACFVVRLPAVRPES